MPEPVTRCPVCGDGDTRVFVDRDGVAVHQNLLLDSARAARDIGRGRLQMRCCAGCGFVYNACFDDALMRYGEHYDNAQHFSPAFGEHLDALVHHLVDERGVQGKRVVEVGCGQGGFLRRLVEPAQWGNRGFGFDPAHRGDAVALDGRLRFERRHYDEDAAAVAADVVICRHVIEHVARPLELLRAVRRALAGSPSASVFFETPCVSWILDNGVLWDLFYEHCSLFTPQSLARAFRVTGFEVRGVRHVFGGQYLWLEAGVGAALDADDDRAGSGGRGEGIARAARAFGDLEQRQRRRWEAGIEALGAGRVALWGAGAKGVTFANLVDPQARLLECVVDVNPAKQGRFLPGTGHPIVAPERLRERGIGAAIALNPNYVGEIRGTVAGLGAATRVIDLMQDEAAAIA